MRRLFEGGAYSSKYGSPKNKPVSQLNGLARRQIACRMMNEDVACARSTESGCKNPCEQNSLDFSPVSLVWSTSEGFFPEQRLVI